MRARAARPPRLLARRQELQLWCSRQQQRRRTKEPSRRERAPRPRAPQRRENSCSRRASSIRRLRALVDHAGLWRRWAPLQPRRAARRHRSAQGSWSFDDRLGPRCARSRDRRPSAAPVGCACAARSPIAEKRSRRGCQAATVLRPFRERPTVQTGKLQRQVGGRPAP